MLLIFIIQEKLAFDLESEKFLNIYKDLNSEKKAKLYKNLFYSLKSVHDKNLVHNDIKEANIMMTEDLRIKLIDFKLSGLIGQETFASTYCYDFPKNFNRGSSTNVNHPAFDVYSMAVTCATMVVGFDQLCINYIESGCFEGNNSLTCFNILKKKVNGAMNSLFGTQEQRVYSLDQCTDYGCIILACIKFNITEIPSLDDVLRAFDNVKNMVVPKVQINLNNNPYLKKKSMI